MEFVGLAQVADLSVEKLEISNLYETNYEEAAQFANVHFIGVGTPQQRGSYAADTRYVEAVIDDLVPQLEGEHLILGKSTVPVGTAAALQERADKLAAAHGNKATVEIAWNPEFLREGYAVKDTIEPDRIVLGVHYPTDVTAGAAIGAASAAAVIVGDKVLLEPTRNDQESGRARRAARVLARLGLTAAVPGGTLRLAASPVIARVTRHRESA